MAWNLSTHRECGLVVAAPWQEHGAVLLIVARAVEGCDVCRSCTEWTTTNPASDKQATPT